MDSKTLATLAFLDAFSAEQGLLTYFADLSGPALRYMPKAIYVKVKGGADGFLATEADANLSGVLAITPQVRPWKFTRASDALVIAVNRTQIPLLPQKQCTLHGVQGKTADPGFIAHWAFPPKLPLPSKWLATYVSLSRP